MKKNFINKKILLPIISIKFLILIVVVVFLIKKNETGISAQTKQSRTKASPVWLGVQVLPIDKTIARELNLPFQRGLLVRRVISNSPASRVGIMRGDIIRRIGDARIMHTLQLRKIINKILPGQKVRVVYIRNMRTRTVYVRLEQAPFNAFNDGNAQLVYGIYPAVLPPTDRPYPYFYFGEEREGREKEPPENE